MVVADFRFWVVHWRNLCKASAAAGDDDVLDDVFLLGGATKCSSFLVVGSCRRALLARFFDGVRFSSLALDTPSSPFLCLSPPLSSWLLLHSVLPSLGGLLDTSLWFPRLASCGRPCRCFLPYVVGSMCRRINVKVTYLGVVVGLGRSLG